jgi:PRC-barrel domain
MTGTPEVTFGTHLCYLNASKVDSPAGALAHLDVQTENGEEVGALDGVLIEPTARRIRYYVIALGRRFGRRRYLLPADATAQLEDGNKALRFRIDLPSLKSCREFRNGDVREFSDTDVLSAMFA